MQGEYILQQGEIGRKEYPLRFPGKFQLFHSIKEEIRKVKREKERASGKYGYQRDEHLTSASFDPPHSALRARGACEARSWKVKKGYSPEKKKKSLPRDLWLQRQRFRRQVSDYGLQMPECQRGMGWDMEAGRRMQAGQMQKTKKGRPLTPAKLLLHSLISGL